MTTTNKSNEAN